MGFTIYKTFKIACLKNINSYEEFLNETFKGKKFLCKFTNIIINIFLCATFFIMISGFGTYINQAFGINKIMGSVILAVISYIIFLKNIEGITKINSIVIPALIVIVLIIGIKNILNIDFNSLCTNIKINDNGIFFIIQAILYASYNLILIMPVLINLKQFIRSKKQIKIVAILVSIIMFAMSILIFFILANVNGNFANIEMPVVYVINQKFPEFNILYGFIILTAIFTTAISLGISFLNNICLNKKYFPQFAAILCISSVIFSPIGFSNLVNFLFPLFGYLGILQIVFVFKLQV